MRFTREQSDCISIHDKNLIVIAGAGSGKTRILVERFTGLLEAHPDWPLLSVVAITFTEKAAREMRDRVRQQIEDRLRDARERQQRELWLKHQAALNSARIGTIHSLCASILRSNPAEAGIDPGFDVLDEIEAGILLDDAVRETLATLARSRLSELLRSYGVATARDVLKQYAGRARSDLACKSLDCGPEELVQRWRDAWQKEAGRLARDAQSDVPHLFAWAPADGWPETPDDKLLILWQRAYEAGEKLASGEPDLFVQGLDDLIALKSTNVGTQKNWGDDLETARERLKIIQEWAKAQHASLLPRLTAADEEVARLLVLWREAIQAVAETYRIQKEARSALDFDDLETLTHNLLIQNPAVRDRYTAEFRHVLVDEFQDTNAAQRDIVYHLTGAEAGRLFLVGDPKQSIYAFRGADISVFSAVRDDLTHRGGHELPLSTSFRTHSALVDAFNDVFSRILQVEDGPAASYQVGLDKPMHAYRPADPARHNTPLSVIAISPADETHYPGWKSADDLRRWEAWEVAQHIHRMVSAGTLIWDRNLNHNDDHKEIVFIPDFAQGDGRGAYRKMSYGDVSLLFQASTHMPLYEDVFKAAGLPYVTVGGKGYYNRQEVWDLLNLLRALHNPADDLALAAALRSPLFGLSDEALYALRLLSAPDGSPLHLWDALLTTDPVSFFPSEDEPVLAFARDVLLDLRDVAGRVTIAELLIRALDRTGYLATLTGLTGGARRRGNVEKLLKLARDSGRVSLGAFNAYARDLTDREIREGEAAIDTSGAAQLMTVHGSKGLEFPVVVLADASWSRNAHHDCLSIDPVAGPALRLPSDPEDDEKKPAPFAWSWAGKLIAEREKAERRRLLYVGATRAQDYLIISGVFKRGKIDGESWLGEWLSALGVNSANLQPSDQSYQFTHAWGSFSVTVPATPPPADLVPRAVEAGLGWDLDHVRAGTSIPGYEPLLPPLMAPVQIDVYAPGRALTATQIAKLGRAPYYDSAARGRAAFRHSVLYDTPEPVRPLADRCMDQRCLRAIIGKMVHRALQGWVLPGNCESQVFFDRLATYAWELHITDPLQVDEAVYAASELLKRFEKSEIPARLENAAQVYRELPFMHRIGQQTINGVLDVLYHDRHGKWHVLDYKTAPVTAQGAKLNARLYTLQLGVYASAVEAKTGQMPDAHLYYIQPSTLIEVKPKDWRAALSRLEDDVTAALDPD